MRSILVVMALTTAVGCANFQKPASTQALRPGTPYWFSYSADRRGATLLAGSDGGLKICAEPFPDVGLNLTSKIAMEAAYQGATGKIDTQFASAVVELAGRTQVVLVLREALFRLCEQIQNGTISDPVQIERMYNNVLRSVNNLPSAAAATPSDTAKPRGLTVPAPPQDVIRGP